MSSYRSEHLRPDHNLTAFDCGSSPLTEWLRRFAHHAEAANTGRTFVWVDRDSTTVVGYFTLAAHLMRRADLPPRIGRGSPDVIPAILLARIALDQSIQGKGLGGQLLLDALERAVEASNRAAGRMIVVDAIDERAQTFYQHFGLQPCPGANRLVRKTSDVAAALLLL